MSKKSEERGEDHQPPAEDNAHLVERVQQAIIAAADRLQMTDEQADQVERELNIRVARCKAA